MQASSPKYSAYIPSKAALDAFAEVVGTETLSDHITFTTIHMPLVETPMIAPSRRLNPMPPITAEHAAAMVVRGLVEKPARIDTPVGTLSDIGMYFTPKLSRRVLHQLYLGYPDSAAARGVAPEPDIGPAAADATPKRPARPVRAAAGPPHGQAGGSVGARRALVTAVRQPVFVDVDTGVDDAMALAYLFGSADAELVGIASTAGNVPVQQVCQNNLGLLELCGITGVPVSKGSETPLHDAVADRRGHPRARTAWAMPGCLRPTPSSPHTTPPRRGYGRRTPTPVS